MWNGILSQNLEVACWMKNFITFKEIWKLITVFTGSPHHHWPLSIQISINEFLNSKFITKLPSEMTVFVRCSCFLPWQCTDNFEEQRLCGPISLGSELRYTTISEGFYITNLRKIRDRINKNTSQYYRSNTTSLTLAFKSFSENGSNNTDHNCTLNY